MANLTDPLALIRGSDPQNLMEYIVRQKVYDSRFWKEECFGLSTVDVLEKAATSLQNVGGTFGGNRRPTKFLCLTLKLLQLQPELSLVEQFIRQDHFKYVKALGVFYLRLVGRPHEIYELLEPLYDDYSKLKYRDVTEWKLVHMDEFIDQIFTQPIVCGIALPRLPARTTLLEAGYSLTAEEDEDDEEEGGDNGLYRPTTLKEAIRVAGGLEAYLKYKAVEEKSLPAIELWQKRYPDSKISRSTSKNKHNNDDDEDGQIDESMNDPEEEGEMKDKDKKHKKKKKKKGKDKTKTKKRKYGTLFKDDAVADDDDDDDRSSSSSSNDDGGNAKRKKSKTTKAVVEEGSEEYWNLEREKLGLKPLRK